jgi:hypothetical protein
MRFSPILTSEQAAMLFGLVKEHQDAIIGRWSFGFHDGLLQSLMRIDRGGGAVLDDGRAFDDRRRRTVFNVIDGTVSSHLICPGCQCCVFRSRPPLPSPPLALPEADSL